MRNVLGIAQGTLACLENQVQYLASLDTAGAWQVNRKDKGAIGRVALAPKVKCANYGSDQGIHGPDVITNSHNLLCFIFNKLAHQNVLRVMR